MALDVELYRRSINVPDAEKGQGPRRISVIDIHPAGATRTLLFVHGYGGNAMQWLYQFRFFWQKMRVIAPDLRGHDFSDDPAKVPYTMAGLVDDLQVVLDALQVQGPIHLIAHSFGGAISTEYALRYPENLHSLVLVGVPTNFVLRALMRNLMQVPDPVFSRMAKAIGVALYAPQRTLKGMLDGMLSNWRGSAQLQEIRVPTLVVLGHRDTVFLRQNY